jgi:hypothetical protein
MELVAYNNHTSTATEASGWGTVLVYSFEKSAYGSRVMRMLHTTVNFHWIFLCCLAEMHTEMPF